MQVFSYRGSNKKYDFWNIKTFRNPGSFLTLSKKSYSLHFKLRVLLSFLVCSKRTLFIFRKFFNSSILNLPFMTLPYRNDMACLRKLYSWYVTYNFSLGPQESKDFFTFLNFVPSQTKTHKMKLRECVKITKVIPVIR